MGSKRILIVEDEPITLMNEIAVLKELGYVLAGTAMSGEVAVELTEKERPDVVLMDIVLSSGMDGVAAAEEIRRRFGTPVVFVSALGKQEEFALSGPAPKGIRYVVKPFSREQLVAAIEAVLAD